MIEIVKHGKRKYFFICEKCGCEFFSDGEEFINNKGVCGIYDSEDIIISNTRINCPECGNLIFVTKQDERPFSVVMPKVIRTIVKS